MGERSGSNLGNLKLVTCKTSCSRADRKCFWQVYCMNKVRSSNELMKLPNPSHDPISSFIVRSAGDYQHEHENAALNPGLRLKIS